MNMSALGLCWWCEHIGQR